VPTPCPLCEAARAATAGSHRSFVTALTETYALLSDNQCPRGWCVLILKSHEEHLADLDPDRQLRIFRDVARMASAIRAVFPTSGKGGGPPRLNYECLGNLVPHIHWHIIPRHADDPDPTKPVWGWPEAQLRGTMTGPERDALIRQLHQKLSP
jgi:diadenosine tetraphosphate (Ap4A) HIT family hydrolase